MQLNFYDAVVSGNLDLGAPIIDAMANNRVVKTNYDGNHDYGKEGNLWDDLVNNNDNNNNGGDGNTNINNGESTDQNGNTNTSGNDSTNNANQDTT